MKEILEKRVAGLPTLGSDAAQCNAAIGLFRIATQHALVALYEWCVARIRTGGTTSTGFDFPLAEARRPSDGGIVTSISELLIAAENLGWKNVSTRWWDRIPNDRACLRILDGNPRTLEGVLRSYVRKRNDGLGHGLPGGYDPEADADLLRLLLDGLSPALPQYFPSAGKLLVVGGGFSTELASLRVFEGDPILYREIRALGGGRARVHAQILRAGYSPESTRFEVEDVFGLEPSSRIQGLNFVATHDAKWNPLGLIPDRPTLEFTGRDNEFQRLGEWFDDEGSRACLVFGDGGVGKTTLIIEFLQRLVEGRLKHEWFPEAIFYYTAKQTQWTVDGIRYIGVARVGLTDSLRSVVSSVDGALGREWYGLTMAGLATKVQAFLAELGISREKTLLVIDNTETLATSDAEVDVLAEELNLVVRRVGRVLLTSRRPERIEAKQIKLDGLPEPDALTMLRARGEVLAKTQIASAGDAKLKQFARQLGCKPLALEVFVHSIEPGVSLDHAFQRVARLQATELGEFLFQDAWLRISSNLRVLLLLMTRISDVHDEVLLKLACQECGVTVSEAEEALQESLGIATITKSAGHLTIAFSDYFRRFCENRTEKVGSETLPLESSLEKVRARYASYLKGINAILPSKDARAFRHATSRAAYAAATDGRVDDAIIFYEEAVIVDGDNAFLWDRYAYFLLRQGRNDVALAKAVKATRLAPKEPAIWFTRGMIEARLGDVLPANRSLRTSSELGWPIHRTWLQRAYAYINAKGRDLDQVDHCINNAIATCPPNDPYRTKHLAEVERLQMRLKREQKSALEAS